MAIKTDTFTGGGGGAVDSVNGQTGVVVVSGNDIAADHSASNYTAANANVDGHLSGIDTKLGTLATGLTYQGAFNATTGAPSIANASQGDLYVISVAGTIYGQTWAVGDHLLINADMGGSVDNAKIDKIDNTDQVTSVNTQTGAVVLSGNDLAADHSASNYTAANANIDGHLSGIDTKFGTLGTASTAASSDFLQVSNNLSDLNNATTARSNLGLGTAAVEDVGTTANDLVQLDGTAKLPAVDGSQLTNLPSAPVTSVNTLTGVVVVSGDDIAADHSASNYTAANANVDGHLSGIDTKFGTLGTASTAASTDFLQVSNNLSDLNNATTARSNLGLGTAATSASTDFLASTAGLDDLSDVAYTPSVGIDNYVLTYDHSTTSWGAEAAASGGLSEIVQDTTPQLGGSLDVNGQDIVSVSNGDIEVDPNGTGSFKIKGNATSGSGRLVLNCEQNTHGITLKGPPHSAAASYTLTFPNTDGTANQVLKTDGSGALDWVDQASGGGGWTYSAITADPANAQASYHYSCTGTFTVTLPTSGVSAGEEIRVKNMGTGTITIDPQTQTIDGSTTDYTMDVQYSAITLVSTGSNWEII